MPDLERGDFVYQSDQELFLVVYDEDEETYHFAVHGWRSIDKNRLDEYLDHQNGKLFDQEQIDELIEEKADDDTKEHYEMLERLFEAYNDSDFDEDGPHTDFAMEDT